MEMQGGMKANVKVYRQPVSHSLYYCKLQSFQLYNIAKWDVKSFPWRRETGRGGERDSLFLAKIA